MVAFAQWAHPPTREAQTGAALAASDWEGVDAACQSMTTPWAIERAGGRDGNGEGGVAGGGRGRGDAAGTPSLVDFWRRWMTMVRMTVAAGSNKQQTTTSPMMVTMAAVADNDGDGQ